MRVVRFCILFVFCLPCIFSQAQSCTDVLNMARENFDAGHFYVIPDLLEPCLKSGLKRNQRIEAYYLLSRTYLFLDQPEKAEESYLHLLKEDPEYALNEEEDPIDLVYLSKKFITTPIFTFYAGAGVNLTSVNVLSNYGMDNTGNSQEEYSNGFGIQVKVGTELNINDFLSVGLEPSFYTRSYSYENTLFVVDNQDYTENQIGFQVPVFLKYRRKFDKVTPYAYAGWGIDLLTNANAQIRYNDRDLSTQSEYPVTGPELNINNLRNRVNSFILFGIGANYRIGYDYVFFDIRYSGILRNIVKEENRYNNLPFNYTYSYIDDDKRLNNYAISVGYVWPLYKPRKIKKHSTKGFINKLLSKGGADK
ncbi:outer membrane beta-barrel protein [Fulvivirga maritima]|uniref:outer membrane beta-barrel protein n=1 Tax=Fulvivirga maritima TaxID=2904247 RepID=UPI001F282234|nr:outer membrane beta-barrel protein [Fulvivirga maritima]UII25236.1 outer membrane beta-barrel protein [Fulvivirga maritima]